MSESTERRSESPENYLPQNKRNDGSKQSKESAPVAVFILCQEYRNESLPYNKNETSLMHEDVRLVPQQQVHH